MEADHSEVNAEPPLMGSASIVVREGISLVLVPSHVTASIRRLQQIKLPTAVAILLPWQSGRM
jgi:hypothetical protein